MDLLALVDWGIHDATICAGSRISIGVVLTVFSVLTMIFRIITERSMKSFAAGRKNWLFTQSIDGADASAFFFSLVETAKACGISPHDYIEAVTTFGLQCRTEEDWKALLPWTVDLGKLVSLRAERIAAQPDRNRTAPYVFSGANH